MTQTPPPFPPYPPYPSDQPPLAYAVSVTDVDSEHLRLLAIFHFILGPLQMLFGLFPLIYVVIGIVFVAGGMSANGPGQQAPPAAIGWLFVVIGGMLTLLVLTFGALTLYSGFQIRAHRQRTFSIVVAGLNCLHFPFGTALGVFTLIVLLRRSVEALYRSTAR